MKKRDMKAQAKQEEDGNEIEIFIRDDLQQSQQTKSDVESVHPISSSPAQSAPSL